MLSRLFARLLVVVATTGAVAGAGSTAWAADICAEPKPLATPSTSRVVGSGTAASCTESALRGAITAGGRVTFRCGGAAATIRVTREIPVSRTTVVDGGGLVTLDGGGANRILVARDRTTLSVRNLRFVNGAADASSSRKVGSGGAVAGLYQTRVEVIGSTFEHNTAGLGGGAVAVGTDSTLSITRSVFTGNSSWYGGAVYSLLSPLTVVNSTFTGNSTTTTGGLGDGGAIGTDGGAPIGEGGTIRICGSVLKDNTGHGSGGGAYLWAYAKDAIIIERTTFDGNTVKSNGRGGGGLGGGARVSVGPTDQGGKGTITIRDTSVLSNTSDGNGGAFYVDCLPTCSITNSTFYGNSAQGYGGAIFGDGHHDNNVTFAKNSAGGHGGALFGKNFVLHNTVLAGNAAHNPWGQAMSCSETGKGDHVIQWLVSSADRSTACVSGAKAANPRLAAPAANGGPTLTMLPAAGSPLLNAGAACQPRDQRGTSRNTKKCDVGAVQRVPYAPASATASRPPTSAAASPTGALARSQPTAGSDVSALEPGDHFRTVGVIGLAALVLAAGAAAFRGIRRGRTGKHAR